MKSFIGDTFLDRATDSFFRGHTMPKLLGNQFKKTAPQMKRFCPFVRWHLFQWGWDLLYRFMYKLCYKTLNFNCILSINETVMFNKLNNLQTNSLAETHLRIEGALYF